jgi:glucosyl-3-phosphoglycerate synthase
MACDVALCLLRTASKGFACSSANTFDGLQEKYLRAARGLLRFYAADARINTLQYDAELEQRTIELFSFSIARAVQMHLANPHAPARAPSLIQIESRLPGFGAALSEAAAQDARM